MHLKAKQYIKQLKLIKHPEGGYFREVYRSGELILPKLLPNRYKSSRNFSTSIYFLLEGKQFSAFHLLQSDETWHFYDGCSVLIYLVDNKGNLSTEKIGKGEDCSFQLTIKRNSWFAAELSNKKSFALFGCTVSPGFEYEDFKLGKREILVKKFLQHQVLIKRLTH